METFFKKYKLLSKVTKDNPEALKHIYIGDFYCFKEKYCEALLEYNHALCFAEKPQTAAICYGKRAIVYFDIQEFDLCLDNIELAQKQQPENDFADLNKLKRECFRLMKLHRVRPDADPMNFFKLSHPANRRLPCLVEGLQLKVDEKYGRHIMATRDFDVGEIIGLTDFSFIYFDKRARLHHCSNCTKSSMKLSLIPCTGCTKAMYCSEECMSMDRKKFHQFECGIENNPDNKLLYYNSLNVFMQILAEFDGNIDEMKTFLESNTEPKNVFDFDLSDKNDPMYKKNMILSTLSIKHNLVCDEKSRTRCLKVHHRFIMSHPAVKRLWMSPNKKFLDDLLLKFLDIEDAKGRINCFSEININVKDPDYDILDIKTNTPEKIGEFYPNIVAHVNDPYMSLLNQSCYPNLITKFVNGCHAWIIVRPVKAGDQLFIFLGPGSRYMTPRSERQRLMRYYFGFNCDCDGCQADYPTQDKMKEFKEVATVDDTIVMIIVDVQLQASFLDGDSPLYNEYKKGSLKLQAMSKFYPILDTVFFESKWMFNIYRLSLPAQWFSRPTKVTKDKPKKFR